MTKTLYVPDHIMEKYNNPNEGVKADRTELQKLPKMEAIIIKEKLLPN